MKHWSVASSIVERHVEANRVSSDGASHDGDDGASAPSAYLLVANKRRNNSIDWSPPGGVVDPGETPLFALTREVAEETGLTIDGWEALAYQVDVAFIDLEMHLTVVTHRATAWSGTISIDDPDGIVQQAQWCDLEKCSSLLADAPQWVWEPFMAAVAGADALAVPQQWAYEVRGERLADAQVVRASPPGS